MMNKTFNLTSTFKSEEQEDGSITVRGMASTKDFDRAGDTIMSEAWTKGGLGNFEKNPIILFNHDYNRPIGRATKVTPTADGLHMEAKISKHADCANLIKDGVLGAFSVGFKVKDADYVKETDGLQIKDAELFEVSVVSVPCNQAATFSLAKSFESKEAYEDFKKTFKSEEDSSSMEIDMSEETKTPEIDLDAFAKKVAEETAAKIQMRQAEEKAALEAEQKAAEETAAEKAAQEAEVAEKVESSIRTGLESGTEKLVADLREEFTAKDAETQEIINKYKAELEEKAEEIAAMNVSKKQFADRQGTLGLQDAGSDLLEAKIFGQVARKGWDNDYCQEVLQKYNVSVGATSVSIAMDAAIDTQFEKELQSELKVAQFFREIPVVTKSTVLPIMPDSQAATFGSGSEADETNSPANLNSVFAGGSADTGFQARQLVLEANRLTSTTYVDNDTDEKTLIALLPMLREGMVRAHARAIDNMVVGGNASSPAISGLVQAAGSVFIQVQTGTNTADQVAGEDILSARALMKRYGMNPQDLVLVVNYEAYNDLLQDPGFADITDVGSELAIKLTGTIGSIFGIPIVVTEQTDSTRGLPGGKTGTNYTAVLVNHRNYVIPRLKGVSIETEYQVANQRNALVASQSLGFHELVAGNTAGGEPAVLFRYT